MRKTIGLFNKDWNTYKSNWQNANGVLGKIGSIFTPASSLSKSDIDAIKAYNSQIDSCVTSQTAFNRTMLNASPIAQDLVASYNGGKVSAQGMATAQNAAKGSTIGLTIAHTALNAAVSMGIGLLVSLVVNGVNKLIHANEEAIEKAEELRKKYEEFKSTNESNVSTLKGLEKEFNELSKGVSQYGDNVSLTTDQYERYKEIIQQIVGISPSLAEGYSTENGYIADKNGLLERAIELQEQEYRNELRKITNLDNLKTSMSGYIAEYKDAFNGGHVTDNMSATVTREFTNFQNAIYDLFNSNNRDDFSSEDIIKQILDSIGIEDVESEIAKYYNEYGYFQSQDFWKDYADIIAQNIQVITNSLNADEVKLDATVFDQNIEKVDSAAQSYLDMKDSISMANESIQRDLGYIAEYANGYSDLEEEQVKFVNEYLKGFNISDIMSESNNPFDHGWKFDEDKMAAVKSQITKFVETLSQDETTKTALKNLYAIPTDDQSVNDFIEQFRSALEIIKEYCQKNGIVIPISISNSEKSINDLDAQYKRVVNFTKDKFNGYDPTAFFNEHSINTQEEIDAWQKIAQGARDATEAEEKYAKSLQAGDTVKKIKSISDALAQSNGTKDGTWADNINDYKEKLSSLESYLNKLRDGDYTPDDLETLAEKFGIIGDTAEERINKIASLMQEETKKAIGVIDKIIASGNVDEKTIHDLNNFKGILQDICDVRLDRDGFKLTENALADVQKLSAGLDQLDKVYADILDKDDFDFSSILNNADFEKEFGAYTDEYNKFIETVTSSPDDINACQSAFNNLASTYIHGSKALTEVTEANKDAVIAMLEQKGVVNAAAIVEQALTENEQMLEAQKYATARGCDDLRDATYEEINALIEEGNTADGVREYLAKLALEKFKVNKEKLSTQADCDELLKLAAHAGATAEQMDGLKSAMEDLGKFDFTNPLGSMVSMGLSWATGKDKKARKTTEQITNEILSGLNSKLNTNPVTPKYSGGSTTRDTQKKLADDAKKAQEEAKKAQEDAKKAQEDIDKARENLNKAIEGTEDDIDFLEIYLDNLLDSASKTKDKIDELLTFGAKKKQTQKAIEETTKAIEAEYKAIKKYSAYADTASGKAAKKASIEKAKEIADAQAELDNAIAKANEAKANASAAANAASNVVSGASVGVVNDARQYIGKLPYIWGGASLVTGADCSGFVQQLYKAYGVNLVRVAQDQFHQALGTKITNRQDLQPGDLVFFGDNVNSIHHVGIYAGNDTYIDEPNSRIGYAAERQFSARGDFVGGKRYAEINSSAVPSSIPTTSSVSSTSSSTSIKPSDTMSAKELQKYQKIWTSIPEKYKKLVREGSFDIETITDEGLKAGIESYQKWWDKIKACKDKIEELQKTLRDLYQTMAELPAQKRDKVVESIEEKAGLYEAERENADTPIVNKKKFNQTKKQQQKAKKSVKKSIRTKKQKTSSGLDKEELEKLNSYMKSGKQIPDSILKSITDGALFEKCREYNDAVYLHSQYAKVSQTANDGTKKFNSLTDKLIKSTQKETVAYKDAYKESSKDYKKSLRKVDSAKVGAKKALSSKNTGLTKQAVDKTLSRIKSGKEIPSELLAEIGVFGTDDVYKACQKYNNEVVRSGKIWKALKSNKAAFQKQKQEGLKQKRDRKIEKYQDRSDKSQGWIDKNNALAENETDPAKKRKYLKRVYKHTKGYYNQQIKIAKANGDHALVEQLRAEKKKALQDIVVQDLTNYSDMAAAKIGRNNALMENETTAAGKNKYLEKNADLIRKEYAYLIKAAEVRKDSVEATRLQAEMQKELTDNTKQKFQNKADENAAKMDYWQLKQDNAKDSSSKNKFERERRAEMVDRYGNLRKASFNDPQEQIRLDEEFQAEMRKSYKAEFDNISNYYGNLASLISNDISDIDNEMKKVEASGRKVDASFYQSKIAFEEKKLAYYKQEEGSLISQLANITMGTDEWYEAQDALQGVQDTQAESLATIKQYKDAINDIAETIQEDILKGFHDITDEADLLITLLGDNFTDSKEGIITDDGLAALSLYVTQLNVCKTATGDLRKSVDAMQNAVDSGQLSFIDANGVKREYASVDEMKEKLQDMYSTYRDEVKHTFDYESKIVNLMKEKYQAEADWLKDLIDKKKESLSAEKDLHDYAKNLKQQTDNIDSLRKQIAALKGDSSKESESRVQKLQAQLKEAEEGLKDTEYDRYISDQQNMLDNMYNEYSALLTDLEKDTDRILREGLDLFAQTGSEVQDTIRDVADQYNYRISSNTSDIIDAIERMVPMETYLGAESYVGKTLYEISTEIKNGYDKISSSLNNGDTSNSIGKEDEYYNPKETATPPPTELPNVTTIAPEKNGSNNEGNAAISQIVSKDPTLGNLSNAAGAIGVTLEKELLKLLAKKILERGTGKYSVKNSSDLNQYVYGKYKKALTTAEMAKLSKLLGLNYTEKQLTSDKKRSAYKTKILSALHGIGLSKGGVVTNGKDLEDYGLRNASGGPDKLPVILTPGERVLTPVQNTMWEKWTASMPKLMDIAPKLDDIAKMPEPKTNNIATNVKVDYGNVNINLPNVKNYQDIMRCAQKDPDFSKLIGHIMNTHLSGAGSFGKYNVRF